MNHLEGDCAVEALVAGGIHDAHATFTEFSFDSIMAYGPADHLLLLPFTTESLTSRGLQSRPFCKKLCRRIGRGFLDESCGLLVGEKEGFNLPKDGLIAFTRLHQETCTVLGRNLQCLVKKEVGLFPLCWSHDTLTDLS